VFVAETLHVKVSYVQFGSNASSDVYLAKEPVLSVAHVDDAFDSLLWYQFIWYVDGVQYCKAVNKSSCLLTFNSAGKFSVNVAATVLVNVTSNAESTFMKRKSKVNQHQLWVKGRLKCHSFYLSLS